MCNAVFYIIVINELYLVYIASLKFQSNWIWDMVESENTSAGETSVKEIKPLCGPVPFPDYSCEESTTIALKRKDDKTTWQHQQKFAKETILTTKKQLSEESAPWHSIESIFGLKLDTKNAQGKVINTEFDVVTEPSTETIKFKDSFKTPWQHQHKFAEESISTTKKHLSEELPPWHSIENIFDGMLDTKKTQEKIINPDSDFLTEPTRGTLKRNHTDETPWQFEQKMIKERILTTKTKLTTEKPLNEESTPWHSIESIFDTMLDTEKKQTNVINSDLDIATKPIMETTKSKYTDETPWHKLILTTKLKLITNKQLIEDLTPWHSIERIFDIILDNKKTQIKVVNSDSDAVTDPPRITIHTTQTNTTASTNNDNNHMISESMEQVPTSWHFIENLDDTTLETEKTRKRLLRPKFLLWGETITESVMPGTTHNWTNVTTGKDEQKLVSKSTTHNLEEQEPTSGHLTETQENNVLDTKNTQINLIRPNSVIWSVKTRRVPNLASLKLSPIQKNKEEEKSSSAAQLIKSVLPPTKLVHSTPAASSSFLSYKSTQNLSQFVNILENFLRLKASLTNEPTVSVTSRSIRDRSKTSPEVATQSIRHVSQQSDRPVWVKRTVFRNGDIPEALPHLFRATKIDPHAIRSRLSSYSVTRTPQAKSRFRVLGMPPHSAGLPDSSETNLKVFRIITGAYKMQNMSINIPSDSTFPP